MALFLGSSLNSCAFPVDSCGFYWPAVVSGFWLNFAPKKALKKHQTNNQQLATSGGLFHHRPTSGSVTGLLLIPIPVTMTNSAGYYGQQPLISSAELAWQGVRAEQYPLDPLTLAATHHPQHFPLGHLPMGILSPTLSGMPVTRRGRPWCGCPIGGGATACARRACR